MGKRSQVWNHFKSINDGKQVQCDLCMAKLTYHSNTTNLANHLKSTHQLRVNLEETSESIKKKKKVIKKSLQFKNILDLCHNVKKVDV